MQAGSPHLTSMPDEDFLEVRLWRTTPFPQIFLENFTLFNCLLIVQQSFCICFVAWYAKALNKYDDRKSNQIQIFFHQTAPAMHFPNEGPSLNQGREKICDHAVWITDVMRQQKMYRVLIQFKLCLMK